MDEKEIFNELIKSSKFEELLGVTPDENSKEIVIIRTMLDGYIRHTSEDNIFKNITKFYDL